MRIALLGPSWPQRGGIARTTTALAAALAQRGTLATFVVPRRQYPSLLYPGRCDTDPAACPRLGVAEALFGVLEPWSWGRAARRLERAAVDCLVFPYWTWAWAPLLRSVQRRTGLPAVAIVHNPADHDATRLAQRAARWVLGGCKGFLCHARAVAQHLERSFPAAPTAVHPLPSDPLPRVDRAAARATLGVASDAVAALFFGLMRPYKGVDVLLEAVAQLPAEAPLVLLLAGEPWGEVERAVRHRLADSALARRVVAHLEWVPEGEASTWFAAADLVVLPYRSATGSAVVAQALGCGLPVVASRVGGLAEVVEDGSNGLLVPPGDAAALAAALLQACQGEVRARLASGAHATAGRWSWASYAGALEELVGRTVGARR